MERQNALPNPCTCDILQNVQSCDDLIKTLSFRLEYTYYASAITPICGIKKTARDSRNSRYVLFELNTI